MLFLLACTPPPDDDAVELPAAPYEDAGGENDNVPPVEEPDEGPTPQLGSTNVEEAVEQAPYHERTGDSDTQTWCRTLVDYRGDVGLIVVDMDTGAWTEEARWSGFTPGGLHTAGLATDGSTWVFSGYEDHSITWYAVDAATGTVTALGGAGLNELSVGWSGTEWVTLDPPAYHLERFATYADLGAGTPVTGRAEVDGFSRLTVDGDTVYGAWHSTNTITVHDLTTGVHERSFVLDGWDTWVWGMSVAGGKLHLIDDARQVERVYLIASFDAATGARLETVALGNMPGRPSGLWCTTAP